VTNTERAMVVLLEEEGDPGEHVQDREADRRDGGLAEGRTLGGRSLSGLSPGPDQDGGEVECGLVGDGELVRSHGQAAPLFERVDASFECVALPISLGVESRWATAGATAPQTVADLVGRLGDDSADSASPHS
jgi:hypothetical protein